ncbi:hypothetical protein CFC21_071318 [Triticum aestivum]|uniref:Disease resistance N-terminal domain-containing protein n=3 Tax=Triticum TaxID=4564 RepID=A0A9R0X7K7_TRITD|nr:hypothetical protein CFC21_071318 [Triticum aestivum]VAI31532.1 unnamed protein product [Triticum turgidum subsp. durum]
MESTVILNGLIASVSSSLAGVIVRAACVRRDVDILTGRLESIMAVIGDAERHRILAQSEAADHRLKKLREIAYEADTIIDLFRIEVGTSRSQLCGLTKNCPSGLHLKRNKNVLVILGLISKSICTPYL